MYSNSLKFGPATILALMFCMAPVIASAQAVAEKTAQDKMTVAQVVDRYYTAMGGKDKLAEVKTIVTKGKMLVPEAGIEGTMEMIQMAPNRMMTKASIPQVMEQQSGFDGEFAWDSSDMMGDRIMDEKETEQVKLQGSMWTLWDYEKNFDSVEVSGPEDFADESCYKITATKEGTNPVEFYFSVKTGLHTGMRGKFETQMGEMEIEAFVTDYREVDGLTLSHKGTVKLPNGMSQVMQAEEITINPDLAEDALAPPKAIQNLIAEKKKKEADKKKDKGSGK